MNRENLRRRGDGFAVVYYVPQELQAVVGRREIVRGLGTRDEKEAMRLKTSKLLEIQAAVHRLATGHREDTASLMREARELAHSRKRMDPYGATIDAFDLQIIERAEGISDRDKSSRRAHRFADVAFGRATPISVAAQEWRGLWQGLSERTRIKYERTLMLFQDHFEDCAIDRVTRRDAIHYVEHLRSTPSERTGKPLSERTIKTEITTLASFFKACIARGFLPLTHENPFERVIVRLPGQKAGGGGRTDLRAVTREEAETLLAACDNANRAGLRPLKYSFEMQAMLRLLWVTGARANEIAS